MSSCLLLSILPILVVGGPIERQCGAVLPAMAKLQEAHTTLAHRPRVLPCLKY